jgi:hypothetical protein
MLRKIETGTLYPQQAGTASARRNMKISLVSFVCLSFGFFFHLFFIFRLGNKKRYNALGSAFVCLTISYQLSAIEYRVLSIVIHWRRCFPPKFLAQELLVVKLADSVKEREGVEHEPGDCSSSAMAYLGLNHFSPHDATYSRLYPIGRKGQARIRSPSLVGNALKVMCKPAHLQVFGEISERLSGGALVEP